MILTLLLSQVLAANAVTAPVVSPQRFSFPADVFPTMLGIFHEEGLALCVARREDGRSRAAVLVLDQRRGELVPRFELDNTIGAYFVPARRSMIVVQEGSILEYDLDGARKQTLAEVSPEFVVSHFVVCADGSRLTGHMSRNIGGSRIQNQLFCVNLRQNVLNVGPDGFHPVFSADCRSIIFGTADSIGGKEQSVLWECDLDLNEPRELVRRSPPFMTPSASPNKRLVAGTILSSDRDVLMRSVGLLELSNYQMTLLVHDHPADCAYPTFSAQGMLLAYTCHRSDGRPADGRSPAKTLITRSVEKEPFPIIHSGVVRGVYGDFTWDVRKPILAWFEPHGPSERVVLNVLDLSGFCNHGK